MNTCRWFESNTDYFIDPYLGNLKIGSTSCHHDNRPVG